MTLTSPYDESYPPSLWGGGGGDPGNLPTQELWIDATPDVKISGPVPIAGTTGIWSLFGIGPVSAFPGTATPPEDFPSGTVSVVASLNVPGTTTHTAMFSQIEIDGGYANAWAGTDWDTVKASSVTTIVETILGKNAGGATIWTRTAQFVRTDPTVGVEAEAGPSPTGVEVGAPGRFTPDDAAPPATIADLRALGLDPGEPWTAEEHVVIGTGNAYWTGDDWARGKAP